MEEVTKDMKALAPIYIVIAFIIILVGSLYATGVLQQAVQPDFVINPKFGYYSCEPEIANRFIRSDIPSVFHEGVWWLNQPSWHDVRLECPGNTANCKLGFKLDCSGATCGGINAVIEYKIYNVYGNEVDSVTDYWFDNFGDVTYLISPDGDDLFLPGESVYIKSITGTLFATFTLYGAMDYIPYVLWQIDWNGYPQIINTDGCDIIHKVRSLNDLINPEICRFGCELFSEVTGQSGEDRVPFDDKRPYLGGYDLGPVENLVTDIDGEQVYCSSKTLFNVDTIQTERWTYLIPNEPKRNVICCPGERTDGKICTDRFIFESIEIVGDSCDIFRTVSSCSGAGRYIADITDPARQTIRKATGCDENNICIYQTQTVGCTSNAQCTDPTKPICAIGTTWTCVAQIAPPFVPTCGNNVCEAGEQTTCTQDCKDLPFCGDGICQSGETVANCPQDCAEAPPIDWMLIIIVLAAVTILASIIFKAVKK